MSNTAPQLCEINQTARRLVLLPGLGDENFLYSADKIRPESPITLQAVKDALVQSDFEICSDIVETLDHPFRPKFFAAEPTALNQGDAIPASTAAHGRVFGVADTVKISARLARNFDHVEKTRKFPKIYGTPAEPLYWIENGRVYFAGNFAQIFVETVSLTKNTTAGGVLQTPLVYENAVICNAAPYLYLQEQNMEGRDFFIQQAMMMRSLIRSGSLLIPQPEQFKKSGV